MHRAIVSAAVVAGIAAGYVAGVAQHDSAASIPRRHPRRPSRPVYAPRRP